MAVTVNSAVDGGRQPSAPMMAGKINADCDASYPADGYDVTSSLPDGVTIIHSEPVFAYDGAALRMLQLANVGSTVRLKVFATANGAKGAELAATTGCAGLTGVDVGWIGH